MIAFCEPDPPERGETDSIGSVLFVYEDTKASGRGRDSTEACSSPEDDLGFGKDNKPPDEPDPPQDKDPE